MKEKEIPTRDLVKLDLFDIKNNIAMADSWDDIREIRDYCNEILEHSGQLEDNMTKNQIISNTIKYLEELKD